MRVQLFMVFTFKFVKKNPFLESKVKLEGIIRWKAEYFCPKLVDPIWSDLLHLNTTGHENHGSVFPSEILLSSNRIKLIIKLTL